MAMDSSVRVTRRVDTHHFVSITIEMGKYTLYQLISVAYRHAVIHHL